MCNVGYLDRIVRFLAGLGLVIAALNGFVWGWIGIVFIVTAIIGFCPTYVLIGFSTGCRVSTNQKKQPEKEQGGL